MEDSEEKREPNTEFEKVNGELIETFGVLGKIQCKLCKEAMKLVEKEVNSHSSKVNMKYLN